MIPKMTNGPSHSPIAIQKMNQKFVKETSLALVWVPCTEAWWSEAPFLSGGKEWWSKINGMFSKNQFSQTFFLLLLFDLLFFPLVLEWMFLKDGVVERNHPTNFLMRWMLSQAKRQGSLVEPFRVVFLKDQILGHRKPCNLGWLYPQTNIAGWNIPIFNAWVTFFSQLC